jgi:hypothetical protein
VRWPPPWELVSEELVNGVEWSQKRVAVAEADDSLGIQKKGNVHC